MAGNQNSGRKRKPTAKHQLDGTYREDRHGGRADLQGDGVLIKPNDLKGRASALWEQLEPQLIAWGACEADSVAVADMCRWWQMYRQALEAKDISGAAKAWNCFNSLAARFGLTLADRAKLEIKVGDDRDELEAKHFGVVG